jgi:hypothetical protein
MEFWGVLGGNLGSIVLVFIVEFDEKVDKNEDHSVFHRFCDSLPNLLNPSSIERCTKVRTTEEHHHTLSWQSSTVETPQDPRNRLLLREIRSMASV